MLQTGRVAMNLNVILNELLERSREVSKKLQENAVNDKEREIEMKNLKEKVTTLQDELNALKARIKAIEITRAEINGFAKYTKLIWAAIAAVAGYLLK